MRVYTNIVWKLHCHSIDQSINQSTHLYHACLSNEWNSRLHREKNSTQKAVVFSHRYISLFSHSYINVFSHSYISVFSHSYIRSVWWASSRKPLMDKIRSNGYHMSSDNWTDQLHIEEFLKSSGRVFQSLRLSTWNLLEFRLLWQTLKATPRLGFKSQTCNNIMLCNRH